MNTRFSTTSRIVILMALLLALALPSIVAAANTVVTPANPDGWAIANKRTDANATISTTEPRGGLGSLEFVSNAVTPGSPSQDKVDFQKLWNSPAVATRTLGNLSKVSYEFYRDSSSTTASHFVPVFRLPFYHDMPPLGTVGAEDYTGYLIWEAIYNGYPAPGGVPADQWIAVDMTTQYFWMFKSSGPGGSGVVQNYGVTLSDWLNGNPQGQPGDPTVPDLDATTLIYGVNTGIGSGWGAGKQFQGFVDNVVVEFGADVVSANFEPNPLCTTVCYADDTGSDANGGTSPADAFKTIQKAIDTVQPGGVVRVLPGSYNETAVNRWVLGVNGPHQFGLFIAKNGVTLQGVTAADVAITDPNATEADITTNATNNFGTSGIFVEGDDVTIAGLEIGPNIPGENKTIEIIGDGFTLKDCLMTGDGIDGAYPYFGDWRYDTGTGVAHIESYTVTHNVFGPGSQVAVSSGAGASGPVSGRKITNNVFTMNAGQTWASISFNGNDTTVPWYTYPVGGAVITGNTFTNNAAGGQHIRVRGVMDDSEFDWASYWNNNTYNKAVVAGVNPPNDVRAWSYTTPDPYVFNGVRVIAAGIQSEIGHAQAGDTVLVKAGTYPESPNVNKSLTLKGETGRDATIIQLQPQPIAATYLGALSIEGDVVTLQGFTVQGFDADCNAGDGDQDAASTNVFVTSTPDTVVIKDNRFKVGAKGACTTYDDAIGVANYYNEAVDVASLTVENNLFLPVNASASRAFYINPGANQFVFRGNTITGQFTAASYTQAKDGLVENNTVTGTGTSRGLGTWGYPDPTVYGKTLFRNNTISNVVNGITIYGSENVTVTKNIFTGNDRAVFVDEDVAFDLSTIHINRNSIAGNDLGVENWYTTDVDATCNWWGAASGPGPVGPGTGDNVTAGVAFAPWLKTADLDGLCFKANVFVSAALPGTTSDGVVFGGEDILMWDGSAWSLWFDGSAAGLAPVGKWKHNLNAIYIPQETGPNGPLTAAESDDLIVSFTQNARPVPGIPGKVDGMDLVKWDGTAWSLWFDGSDVGLTAKTPEKIDALHVLPGAMSPIGANCQAYLLVSTQGPGTVPNPAGGKQLKFSGEDLLGFCMTNWGTTTTGMWHIVLDGSTQDMPKNSLDSISASPDGMTYYLTTRGNFKVDTAQGGHSMVYVYDVATQTFSGPVFSAQPAGLPKKVDALHVELLP